MAIQSKPKYFTEEFDNIVNDVSPSIQTLIGKLKRSCDSRFYEVCLSFSKTTFRIKKQQCLEQGENNRELLLSEYHKAISEFTDYYFSNSNIVINDILEVVYLMFPYAIPFEGYNSEDYSYYISEGLDSKHCSIGYYFDGLLLDYESWSIISDDIKREIAKKI